jgi:hypothetical protein
MDKERKRENPKGKKIKIKIKTLIRNQPKIVFMYDKSKDSDTLLKGGTYWGPWRPLSSLSLSKQRAWGRA